MSWTWQKMIKMTIEFIMLITISSENNKDPKHIVKLMNKRKVLRSMRRSILQGCRITSKKGSCQGHQTITKTFRLAMSLFEVNISNKTSFKSHHHKISLRKRAWRRILLPLNRNLLLPWIKRENQFKKVFTTISCK